MKTDNFLNPLDFQLCNDGTEEIERVASDELDEVVKEEFFYGEVTDSDDWILDSPFEEGCRYFLCPECGKMLELDAIYSTGDQIQCPECCNNGVLYDFRDHDLPLECVNTQSLALLDTFEKGFVLRLFDVGLDYSDRDYDDYETLSCYPTLSILEVGREYWCEGHVSYFRNKNTDILLDPEFEEVKVLDDEEYWITNYNNDFNSTGTSMIADLLYEDAHKSTTFMEYATRGLSYLAFKTLKKYGFHTLVGGALYAPATFRDSAKISEILEVDYNQVSANFSAEEFDISDLLAARELNRYGLPLTGANVEIMQKLDTKAATVLTPENARKTFKYLRNQLARSKKSNTARDYADYFLECQKLGYDLTSSEVLYPTNLNAAHSKTSALIKIEDNRETEEGIRRIFEKYHALCEWSDGLLTVVMPSSCDQIITEGAEQNHCVGNYCERVAKGEDLILFIRQAENPDKSFYTMEIRPGMKKLDIVQCRGYGNKDKSEETAVAEFLERYEKWFNRRPVVEAAESMKRVYYKAVKKTSDGRYLSDWDKKTEYRIGEIITANMCDNPDKIAVSGIHVASLKFAQKYGDYWTDVAILEIEVDLADVVIPDAKDQIRASRGKVLREVPMSEMGQWGELHGKPALEKTA